MKQLLPLVEQLSVALLLGCPLRQELLVGGPELGLQLAPQLLGQLIVEPDRAILLLDELLHQLDREGALLAAGALLVPADADEVLVARAVTVGGVLDDEAAAALPAEDAALEVVVVEALLLAGVALGGQHVLDRLPQLGTDQRLVTAWVLDATVAHDALVVGVLQQPGEVAEDERLAGPLLGRAGGQSAGGQLGQQGAERPLAAGIGIEGEAHERRAFLIQLDSPQLAAVVEGDDIAVADRGTAGRAAGLGLLGHALEHLGTEVAGVELGDRAHDAVQQHAARGLVDVFRDGDQPGAGLLDHQVDHDVVGARAGQAVDLVNDDVADGLVLQVLE